MDQQDAAGRGVITPYVLSSGGRELLKWIALAAMTGDHIAKVVVGGYVPVVSEFGRVAFPLFALVMACNLAQPGVDRLRLIRRLLLWGVIAQPVHALASGAWLPLNILLTFAVAVAAVHALASNRPWLLLLAGVGLPFFVDYRWFGVGLVLLGWIGFRHRLWWLPVLGLLALCWHNGNGWALLAVPLMLALARVPRRVPRWRWLFYVYYVGHLALLAAYARMTG